MLVGIGEINFGVERVARSHTAKAARRSFPDDNSRMLGAGLRETVGQFSDDGIWATRRSEHPVVVCRSVGNDL